MADILFEIVSYQDSKWSQIFNSLDIEVRDVFFSPQMAQFAHKNMFSEFQVLAAISKVEHSCLIYPFVLRKMNTILGENRFSNYADIRSIYGRGGLIASNSNFKAKKDFWITFINYLKSENIICSFARVHPKSISNYAFQETLKLHKYGDEIVIDLSAGVEEVLKKADHSVRKNFNKAKSQNYQIKYEVTPEILGKVYNLYVESMIQNNAERNYFYSLNLFEDLIYGVTGKFVTLYSLWQKTQLVAFEIVLHSGALSHSFLGATRYEFRTSQANTYLKISLLKHLAENKIQTYYLGGGLIPNDGIFNYKKKYAPHSIESSYIESTLFNEKIHKEILEFHLMENRQINKRRLQFYDIGP